MRPGGQQQQPMVQQVSVFPFIFIIIGYTGRNKQTENMISHYSYTRMNRFHIANNVCMYVYIYIYMYRYVYVSICIYMYVYMCVWWYTWVLTSLACSSRQQ
jgi:hypothetical protein